MARGPRRGEGREPEEGCLVRDDGGAGVEVLLAFIDDLLVEIAGGNDKDGLGGAHGANGNGAVMEQADFEDGPDVGGNGFAEASVLAQDEAVVEARAGEVLALESFEFHKILAGILMAGE